MGNRTSTKPRRRDGAPTSATTDSDSAVPYATVVGERENGNNSNNTTSLQERLSVLNRPIPLPQPEEETVENEEQETNPLIVALREGLRRHDRPLSLRPSRTVTYRSRFADGPISRSPGARALNANSSAGAPFPPQHWRPMSDSSRGSSSFYYTDRYNRQTARRNPPREELVDPFPTSPRRGRLSISL